MYYKHMSHHNWWYVATTNINYVIMIWYVTTGTMSPIMTQLIYNIAWHGMSQQQTFAMSHAMKQQALCHVLWYNRHNNIQFHNMIFCNKMQYVVTCYASVNSMPWQRKALFHDMVCHINRHHILTRYETTSSMS